MRILLASKNLGKIKEFRQLLGGIDLIPLPVDAPDIPENGAFFKDNAIQKAEFARKWFLNHEKSIIDGVLADDSGLCIDALCGAPGVLTARFANSINQHARNELLLSRMPKNKSRSAQFVCVLAWISIAGELSIFDGIMNGKLAIAPKGIHGFGYDPIFIPDGFDKTLGELSHEVKHQISHRNKAVHAFLDVIKIGTDIKNIKS